MLKQWHLSSVNTTKLIRTNNSYAILCEKDEEDNNNKLIESTNSEMKKKGETKETMQ